jgi:type I restriction enzyme, S subunit
VSKTGTLPSSWAEASIEQILDSLEGGKTLQQGWSPQCEREPSPTEEIWGVLRTTSIQSGAFLAEHNKRLPQKLEPRPGLEVKPGDILLTCAGPRSRCGVAALVRNTRSRLMISGKMYRFRPAQGIDPRYLEAYLKTAAAQHAIDQMKTGGSDSGLNLTHSRFRLLPIPLAPSHMQIRIMDEVDELLSDLNAAVAALERSQKKLTQYRAATLKAAVEGKLTDEWRQQHPEVKPASDLLDRILAERRQRWEQQQLRKYRDAEREPPKNWKTKYKEPDAPDITRLPALPKGWCWATCEQLTWSAGYGTSEKCRKTNVGLAVLRIPNIIGGRLDLNDLKYAPPSYLEEKEESVDVGDLLVVRTNGSRSLIGRGAVVLDSPNTPLSFASYLIRLRFVPHVTLLKWISVVWASSHVRSWIENHAATSAGQYNINLTSLLRLSIPVPPQREYETIADLTEDQFSIAEHLQADLQSKLRLALGLRDSILRSAFLGELVPQDPKDESAS